MLFYGTSLIGTSHIKKGTVCQDSHKAILLRNGWAIGCVADGVGSAKHSEIASKMAVDIVIDFCNEKIDKHFEFNNCLTILKDAYELANNSISKYVEENKDNVADYDTTLSVVIFNGEKIAYGHSGDGGIVGLLMDGKYERITHPQKAEDGVCVIPLRAGKESWQFGICDNDYSSVLLATDGVYDTFFPYLLKGQANEVYVPLIQFFMDNNFFKVSKKNVDELLKSKEEFLNSESYSSVTDDKTVLVIFNEKKKSEFQDEDYYKEPDWNVLQLEWNKKAYPHLYKNDDLK